MLPTSRNEAEIEQAIAFTRRVLEAAQNGNQHGEDVIVLMASADMLRRRVGQLEEALDYVLTAHGEQLTDAFDKARRLLVSRTVEQATTPTT